jgi:cytochrome c
LTVNHGNPSMFTLRSSTCFTLAATMLLAGCGQGDNTTDANEAAARTRPVARFELAPAATDTPAPAPVAQETAPPVASSAEPPAQTVAASDPSAGAEAPAPAVAASDSSAEPAGSAPAQPAPVANAEALAQARGCFACHRTDVKLIGPAYKEVAAKYAGQDAADALAEKVIKGGAGVWGAMPMTPNNIPADEAKQLVAWILSQK